MSEKTPPNVKQTMSEKVLIKYQALSADRYHTIITQQAQKKASELYKQTKQQQEAIYQTAYQQGYNDGIKQLLTDFIHAVETSEIQYQENISQSKEQLMKILNDIFGDNHLQETVATYFERQCAKTTNTTLHLPEKMQTRITIGGSDMKFSTTADNTIALEVDNRITYFSPVIASKNIFPHVFSVPTQCQILKMHKNAYQNLITTINSIPEEHKYAD
ncbi:hypothetical protein AB6H26_18445 [Providencia hangzhouensis]|uniref:Type III secretion apparatus protein, HrpE/YscL family n=4 Tax=Providencia TaxID=586 RepID=A0A264VYT8_PRORE|nr:MULTISPECIES: hypothetical protein [Providencia]MBN6367687.1 hypothetical protein [Providencia rettgeri]MBN7840162.1 hypothetical protein [Providencia rettgeri]MBN7853018.1 hypothetical protein [Providencia rettgeri]MBN7863530.1 hypothetical protein [Providencia rettgeri]MBN7871362.1 hypothetical protein [Providencia rettgeri]